MRLRDILATETVRKALVRDVYSPNSRTVERSPTACLSACFCRAGEIPLATCTAQASRRARAAFNETKGYLPS